MSTMTPGAACIVRLARWVAVTVALVAALPFGADEARGQGLRAPRLVFVVHGLRSDAGLVSGGLYASGERWPTQAGSIATCHTRIVGRVARCAFRAPPPGRYAFACFHDEDADARFDRDLFGVPDEGYGFSNDARPSFAAPPFERAAFVLGPLSADLERRVLARYGWSP